MAKFYYGCDEVNRGWDHYFELCNALELDLQSFEAPPRIDTLNSWRVDSPKGFCFILHADAQVPGILADLTSGPSAVDREELEFPDELDEAWERTIERAHALAAKAILLQTPSSITPGGTNRALLEKFVEAYADEIDAPILWEPSGLWTIEQTREAAAEMGLVPVYDPFLAEREGLEFTHGDAGFVLSERAGMRRQFDLFDVKNLIQWTEKYDRLFTMLRGRHKWAHAQHFRSAIRHEAR